MCRYAIKDYKSHFACFDCRKTFKKASISDWVKQKGIDLAYTRLTHMGNAKVRKKAESEFNLSYQDLRDQYLDDVSACPQCGKSMASMGFDFKAPKQRAIEQWQIIALLYENGFAFQGCGCGVGYSPPEKISDLHEFFKQHQRLKEGEKLLVAINKKPI